MYLAGLSIKSKKLVFICQLASNVYSVLVHPMAIVRDFSLEVHVGNVINFSPHPQNPSSLVSTFY
jgi:hypothetical protein